MGVAVGIFGFLTVVLSFVAAKVARFMESQSGVDLASIALPIVAALAAAAAADSYKHEAREASSLWRPALKLSISCLIVHVLIIACFDAIVRQGFPYSQQMLGSLAVVWAISFAMIVIGVNFGLRRKG